MKIIPRKGRANVDMRIESEQMHVLMSVEGPNEYIFPRSEWNE